MSKEVESCKNNIDEFRKVIGRIKMRNLMKIFHQEDDTVMELNKNNELIKVYTPNIKELLLIDCGIESITPEVCCNFPQLSRLVIGEGVKRIDREAFRNCQELEELTLPVSLVKIQPKAFFDCPKLGFVNYNGDVGDWMDLYYQKSKCESFNQKSLIIRCANGSLSFCREC